MKNRVQAYNKKTFPDNDIIVDNLYILVFKIINLMIFCSVTCYRIYI